MSTIDGGGRIRSLVVPVYRNEENVPALIAVLEELSLASNGKLEVVCVVDGSPDQSGELLVAAVRQVNFPLRVVFHSRNFGSFTAIRTGLEFASGNNIAVMAADLQEPPELVLEFFSVLERGESEVVFGQRIGRNDSPLRNLFSNAFWGLYRKIVMPDIPPGGVDIFACNRTAVDALLQIEEPNSSLVAQLFWIGFRRSFIPYTRRERQHGRSAWSFTRRLRYMMDSVFSFSDVPILCVLWFGLAGCVLSFLFGVFVVASRMLGLIEIPGYAGLAALIAFSSSAGLAAQGVLGSYIWRTFENTKRRPLRLVARVVEDHRFDQDGFQKRSSASSEANSQL